TGGPAVLSSSPLTRGRRRGGGSPARRIAPALWIPEDEAGDDPAALAGKHVVGARGGIVGHALQPDAARQERRHHLRGREHLARARAQQHQFRRQPEDGVQVRDRQRRRVPHRPVLDQRVRRDHEAAGQPAFVDQRRPAVRAAQEEVVVGAFEVQVHGTWCVAPVQGLGSTIWRLPSEAGRYSTATLPIFWTTAAPLRPARSVITASRWSRSSEAILSLTSSWCSSAPSSSATTAAVTPLPPTCRMALRSCAWPRRKRIWAAVRAGGIRGGEGLVGTGRVSCRRRLPAIPGPREPPP